LSATESLTIIRFYTVKALPPQQSEKYVRFKAEGAQIARKGTDDVFLKVIPMLSVKHLLLDLVLILL
jgi:hypothetical protein